MLSSGDLKLRRCSNVDWGGDSDGSKLTSGHALALGGRAMSWCIKKQNCTTMSAMEADCVSCYHGDTKHCHEVYID